MNINFATALQAATEACSSQSYPPGSLYVVATPIGNLADITLRALYVLRLVDVIACEDTRHTAQMLRAYGLAATEGKTLLALHQHNEMQAAQDVIQRLSTGQRIAYVSDAGTPAISDPGAKLVQAAQQAGFPVVPLPGASSATAALSAAGVVQEGGYRFQGFLPHGATDRKVALQQAFTSPCAVILFEAPHRIATLAKELSPLGSRRITVAREITKQFESIHTLSASDWPAHLQADPNACRGEFVVVIHPADVLANGGAPLDIRVLTLLLAELPVKAAVKLAAEITGQSRNELYAAALALRQS